MNNNASGKLYKIGIIILGLIIASYVLFMILLDIAIIIFRQDEPQFASIPLLELIVTSVGAFSYRGIPLIIPVSALFLVRKFPIVVGAIFLGIGGLLSSYWMLMQIEGEGFILLCPFSVLFLLDGILFLISGLIKRRYTLNNGTNKQ